MFRPRVIPTILLDDQGHAVKSVRFRKPLDLGDSVNIVSLFNAFRVDELVVLDTMATARGRGFSADLMSDISSEAKMPLSVGGGVGSCGDVYRLLHAGAEKVILSSAAFRVPQLVREAADNFGSSSITVCIDVKRDWRGRYKVDMQGRGGNQSFSPAEAAARMEDLGAGELIIQSIDSDGTMNGYDLTLTALAADAVGVPVIAMGGAGSFAHVQEANEKTYASAFASGSLFCFQDRNRGVLISYPSDAQLASLARAV